MAIASDMAGRAALVTGATGDLGKGIARALLDVGAAVCLVDPDSAALEAVAAELGGRTAIHASDVRGSAKCRAAVEAAVAAFGRLDALCNVANFFAPSHSGEMAEADWEATLSVNLSAPFYLFQAALPHLLADHGTVVTLASCAAFMATPYTAAYTASKAGVVQLTKVLAKEYLDQPIRINCITLGNMAVDSGNPPRIAPNVDMRKVQRLARELIDVREIAELTAFLLSDASKSFHGSAVTIDTGLSLG